MLSRPGRPPRMGDALKTIVKRMCVICGRKLTKSNQRTRRKVCKRLVCEHVFAIAQADKWRMRARLLEDQLRLQQGPSFSATELQDYDDKMLQIEDESTVMSVETIGCSVPGCHELISKEGIAHLESHPKINMAMDRLALITGRCRMCKQDGTQYYCDKHYKDHNSHQLDEVEIDAGKVDTTNMTQGNLLTTLPRDTIAARSASVFANMAPVSAASSSSSSSSSSSVSSLSPLVYGQPQSLVHPPTPFADTLPGPCPIQYQPYLDPKELDPLFVDLFPGVVL